eukprot:jgi/Ulvmu1/12536/UM090_0023.1
MVLPPEATVPSDANSTAPTGEPPNKTLDKDVVGVTKSASPLGVSTEMQDDEAQPADPTDATVAEGMPHAAERQPPPQAPADEDLALDTGSGMSAGARSDVAPAAGDAAAPARVWDSEAREDGVLPVKNGVKDEHSPASSLSLHPTSSDSEEGLAMGQRMQQLARSISEGGTPDGDMGIDVPAAVAASAPLSAVISVALPATSAASGHVQPPPAAHPGDYPLKTCSLCGNTKPLRDFGPKKGARDGKDCYCRVCSTLRRRYSIPVVRAAVENGTIQQLMGQSKSKVVQNADPSLLSKVRPPRTPATGPCRTPQPGPPPAAGPHSSPGAAAVELGGAVTACTLCGERYPAELIAVIVGGEAFCGPCDRTRRRANNLGLSTREVVDLHRAGHLAGMLGEDPDATAAELAPLPGAMAMVPAAPQPQATAASAAMLAGAVDTGGGQEAIPAGVKPPMGRICRMCRQVRAPVIGFQRLSYCADCEVIKGRAQTRGFSVAQVQDAFEVNGVLRLFGQLYSFMVGGTRFDAAAGGTPCDPAAAPMHGVAAAPMPDLKPLTSPTDAAAAESGEEGGSHGRGRRKRKAVDISDMIDDDNLAGLDGDWQAATSEAGAAHAAAAAAAAGAAGAATPPYKVAKNGVLMRRCALCRAIRPLDDFPLDGKRSHGRACYCRPCKRLRGRAAAVSRSYDVAWLRAALEAGELRQRLGSAADSVLVPSVPHKPVTTELSPDATFDWPPPTATGGTAYAAAASPQRRPPAVQPLAPLRPALYGGGAAAAVAAGVRAGSGPLPALASKPPASRLPPLAPPGGALRPAPARQLVWEDDEDAGVARSDSEATGGATGITRSILAEHREFARMYLAVRERMLVPDLSPAQLEVEQQTAAELEAHLHMLRDLIRKAFLG